MAMQSVAFDLKRLLHLKQENASAKDCTVEGGG